MSFYFSMAVTNTKLAYLPNHHLLQQQQKKNTKCFSREGFCSAIFKSASLGAPPAASPFPLLPTAPLPHLLSPSSPSSTAAILYHVSTLLRITLHSLTCCDESYGIKYLSQTRHAVCSSSLSSLFLTPTDPA